jgi:nucleotide-binding universal stress UspA family protein
MNAPTTSSSASVRTGFTMLVPLDGSPLAEQALPVAAQVCHALAGHLVVARVLPYPVEPLAAMGGYIPGEIYQDLEDDQRRLAQDYLKPLVERLETQGLSVEIRLEEGQPASVLLDVAKRLPADLIVMTSHGRTGLARFALGSVADRLVRDGEVPVLLLRSFATSSAPANPRRALIPLDGTQFAERALDLASRLAGPLLREVTLLQVVDPRDGSHAVQEAQWYLDVVRGRLLERLTTGACTVHTLVRTGSAADAILACAEQGQDLILMATHGGAGIDRWVVGTVTDRVLRGGQTPLLLVHPPHDHAASER